MISVLEPFANQSQIILFMSQLQMDHSHCNVNNKIWLFWSCDVTCKLVEVHDEHITCEINHLDCTYMFLVTYVYDKCKDYLRSPLWDKMLHYADTIFFRCVVGDFNVISSTNEKVGGRIYNMNKSSEFISIIEACGLVYIGYYGHPFTWCNQRGARI